MYSHINSGSAAVAQNSSLLDKFTIFHAMIISSEFSKFVYKSVFCIFKTVSLPEFRKVSNNSII
jgi:hypothetical protein